MGSPQEKADCIEKNLGIPVEYYNISLHTLSLQSKRDKLAIEDNKEDLKSMFVVERRRSS
jgi:hypothetical protein